MNKIQNQWLACVAMSSLLLALVSGHQEVVMADSKQELLKQLQFQQKIE